MANYHINNEGNAGACRAKKKPCPFGGWDDHYSSKEEAREGYEKQQELLALISTGKTKEHPSTTHALESSLKYTGKIPKWMNKLSNTAEKTFGSKPEIIDTVELNGQEYAVVWNKHSTFSVDFHIQKERGYRVSAIEYRNMKTGEIEGYVKAAIVDEDSVKYSFGDDEFTAYRSFQDRDGGAPILEEERVKDKEQKKDYNIYPAPYDENTDDETRIAEKKKIWKAVHQRMESVPEGFDRRQLTWGDLVNLTEEHAPDDEKTLDEQIKVQKEKIEEEHEKFKKSHRVPVIDFSKLENNLRGQGAGTSMYVYTARKLAEEGKMLSSSGLQSDEAKSLWRRMAADPRLNVKVISRRYERDEFSSTKQALALDFREDGKKEDK